jgi:hypothetical protein
MTNDYKRNLEIHRLHFLAMGILHKLEESLSKLRDAFLTDDDYEEARKTINRLHSETLALDKDVMDKLNGGCIIPPAPGRKGS